MHLGKPARNLLALGITLAVTGAATLAVAGVPHISSPTVAAVAFASYPVAWLVISVIVDEVELAVRRRTRDPRWLCTVVGRSWLASPRDGRGRSPPAGRRGS